MTENRKLTINLTWLLALAAVFVVLKLAGAIDWSWFWVLSPALFCAVILVAFITAFGILAARGDTTVRFSRVRRDGDR